MGGGGSANANRGGIVISVLELAEYLTAGDSGQVYDMADRDGSGDCSDLDGEGSQGGRVKKQTTTIMRVMAEMKTIEARAAGACRREGRAAVLSPPPTP